MTFEEIYRQYSEKILNMAFRFTGNQETARDLTQDVFVKVYQNLENFQHRSQVYTWIYRIATNHFINYVKKERKWRWIQLLDKNIGELLRGSDSDLSGNLAGYSVPPDRQLERAEREKLWHWW